MQLISIFIDSLLLLFFFTFFYISILEISLLG